MSNEKFKVGDLVEIKQWDEMTEEFGINDCGNIKAYKIFTKSMKSICGKRFKIKRLENGLTQDFEGCTISTDMIKEVDLHKNKYQCTGDLQKPSFSIYEFEKALDELRNANNIPYDSCLKLSELMKKQHGKYEVISGNFEGFVGEIVDSNKGYIGLGNEFGERCYVKRDNIKRVRINYIGKKFSHKYKLRSGAIIEVLQDQNKTRVEITKDNKTFIGEAYCMEGDSFNKIKGIDIARRRAYIKFHQYKVTKFTKEMIESTEISKEYIKYKLEDISFGMNRILKLKEDLKELCK